MVGDFNLACEEGHATDLINVAEALQEKKVVRLPMISIIGRKWQRVKLVLISGPSSSVRLPSASVFPYNL